MTKVHGYIILSPAGKPQTDHYGDIILYLHHEDAVKAKQDAETIKKVITARVTRTKKKEK